MKLCVIPARGGSKRIPRKNIKLFHGKPIIAYSIEAAQRSGCFDKIIVSTDDQEIAAVAKEHGAEVPFMRPGELSDDFTGSDDVIRHAITWYKDRNVSVDYVCCVYATAPFVLDTDLKSGFDLLVNKNMDFVFSAGIFSFPIQRAIKLNSTGIEPFYPAYMATRSQDLEPAYHDAGQFYWGKSSAYLENRAFYSHKTFPIVLPSYRVQDIDTEGDWTRAELLFRALKA